MNYVKRFIMVITDPLLNSKSASGFLTADKDCMYLVSVRFV